MADRMRYHSQPHAGWSLWLQWLGATAIGELLGFIAPAVAGSTAAAVGLSDLQRLPLLVLAGMIEGATFSYVQWLVLRRYLPQLSGRTWIGATAVAAGIAWALVLLALSIPNPEVIPIWVLIIAGVLFGSTFLVLIGGAQWLALRHVTARAGWWILANAIGWPIGVIVSIIGIGLIPDGASLGLMIVIGIASGVMMGIIVGAITGGFLVWLLRDRLAAPDRIAPSMQAR